MKLAIVFLAAIIFLAEANCHKKCLETCGEDSVPEGGLRKRRHKGQKPRDIDCPVVDPMVIYRDCEDGTM